MTELTEGIDINKTSSSKDCDICPYWYCLDKGFSFNSMSAMYVMMYQQCLITIIKLLF